MIRDINKTSKFLSLILRHKPEVIGISLDGRGYANVSELIEGIQEAGEYEISFHILKEIVDTDKKGRYSFNEDFTKIRANQGHSLEVDVELEEIKPVKPLYHGTADRFLDSIASTGIEKRQRLFVHLTDSIHTALMTGQRHGKPVVLKIDTQAMLKDGYKFYLSKNGVYLTDHVPFKYVTQL